MSELITQVPMRIVHGPCQTSTRREVDYLKDSATATVTNQNGISVPVAYGLRFCVEKSRTNLSPDRSGMGVVYEQWERYSKQLIHATLHGGVMPPIPVTEAALWAEEIQAQSGITLAMEIMDWVHASLFVGHIQPGLGMLWTPSVMNLGEPAQMEAEVAGENNWIFGIKNGKWYPRTLPNKDGEVKVTSLEKTQAGMGTYAVGVTHLPKELVLIQRGMDVPEKGLHRNLHDHQSARLAKQLLEDLLEKQGIHVPVACAFDPSHVKGGELIHEIVPSAIEASTLLDLKGKPLYNMLLIESMEKGGEIPKSDADQHITGDDVQLLATAIAQLRPIQGYK